MMALKDPASAKTIRDDAAVTALIFAFCASFLWPGLGGETPFVIATLGLSFIAFLVVSPGTAARVFTPRQGILFLTILTMMLFALWLSFRAVTSDIPARGLATLASYLLPVTTAFAVMGISTRADERETNTLIQGIQSIIAFLAGWSVFCALFPPLHPWLGSLGRAEWPFADANHLAMVMNAGIFLTLGACMPHTGEKPRPLSFVILVLCILGLFATGSRGGILGFLVGMIFFWALRPSTLRIQKTEVSPRFLFTGILSGLLITAIPFLFPSHWMAMTGFSDLWHDPTAALGSRPELWRSTLSLIAERPWFGYGTGSFASVFPSVITPAHLTSAYAAHNDVLQITLETGMIGGVLYLGLVLLVLSRAFLLSRTENTLPFLAGAAAMLAALFLQAQIEFMWGVLPVLILSGIGIGLILRSVLPKTNDAKTRTGKVFHRITAAILFIALLVSITGIYAEYALKRAERYLAQGNLERFADDLHTARAFSFDLHAVPYARAADYRLTLLLAGPLSNGPSPDAIQDQITAALTRDPYLPMAYELQGRLDEVVGKTPLPAWERGLEVEPRSASLRLALLRYHEKRGHAQDIQRLADDTRVWQGLRGPVSTLMNALAPYQNHEKTP